MSKDGSRVLFSFNDPPSNLAQLAILDINPSGLGASPALSDITVNPGAIALNPSTGVEIKAKITPAGQSDSVWYVGDAVLMDGIMDQNILAATFYDDGTSAGDQVANDRIYTHNNVYAYSNAVPGPRVLRIDAEVYDANGYLQGTAVDVEPLYVVQDTSMIGIGEVNSTNPPGILIENIYPNPANSEVNISYYLSESSHVLLAVMNAIGKTVALVQDDEISKGGWQMKWNVQDLAAGIYFVQLEADGLNEVKKLIISR